MGLLDKIFGTRKYKTQDGEIVDKIVSKYVEELKSVGVDSSKLIKWVEKNCSIMTYKAFERRIKNEFDALMQTYSKSSQNLHLKDEQTPHDALIENSLNEAAKKMIEADTTIEQIAADRAKIMAKREAVPSSPALDKFKNSIIADTERSIFQESVYGQTMCEVLRALYSEKQLCLKGIGLLKTPTGIYVYKKCRQLEVFNIQYESIFLPYLIIMNNLGNKIEENSVLGNILDVYKEYQNSDTKIKEEYVRNSLGLLSALSLVDLDDNQDENSLSTNVSDLFRYFPSDLQVSQNGIVEFSKMLGSSIKDSFDKLDINTNVFPTIEEKGNNK